MKSINRRKREHKTDYGKRLKLLKSGKPRIVFRKTNKYIIAQYVTSEEAQDEVKIGINSKKLLEYGWPKENKGSLKSIPASYLTGILIGKKILEEGSENRKFSDSFKSKKFEEKETPIADFGMLSVLHKTKIFAFLKGLTDAGLKIKCDSEAFPPQERIEGKHMNKKIPFSEILKKISEKSSGFSASQLNSENKKISQSEKSNAPKKIKSKIK